MSLPTYSPISPRRRTDQKGLPRFFTKQLLAFLLLAFIIIVIDLFLYVFIAVSESERVFDVGTPSSAIRVVDAGLALSEGSYTLSDEAEAELAAQGAWALLIDAGGTVTWSHNLPADVPLSYSLNDVALSVHYGTIADYPTFFWDRGTELLAMGFPKGSYWHMTLSYPESTMRNLPLYILLIFVVDLGILFTAYFITRRRTQRAVAPVMEALDNLSEGRPASLALKGDLRQIGAKITDTSSIIEQKDLARANWIRGVSHDIRTPLSLILGHADGIAADESAPPQARAQAAIIRAQGLKIRDLVADLNAASQLDYDMQPLHLERIPIVRLTRDIVAAHANSGLDEQYPVELFVAETAAEAVVLGDERLLVRAIENILANARLHNEEGCAIRIDIEVPEARGAAHGGFILVRIADKGAGITADKLSELEERLARAHAPRRAASCDARTTGADAVEHGLGLVLVDRIICAHGGSISLGGTCNAGFTVEMRLPVASGNAD